MCSRLKRNMTNIPILVVGNILASNHSCHSICRYIFVKTVPTVILIFLYESVMLIRQKSSPKTWFFHVNIGF